MHSHTFLKLVELTFSSANPSLLKFDLDEKDGYRLQYMPTENIQTEKDRHIQNGIMEFVRHYHNALCEIEGIVSPISGEDAFAPIFEFSKNEEAVLQLFGKAELSSTPGFFNVSNFETMQSFVYGKKT